jgi:hypothetical protein
MKNLRDSYKYYLSQVSEEKVDIKTYLKVTHLFMKYIIKKVIEGNRVCLPQNLGSILIVGKKIKVNFDKEGKITGLSPDWKRTNELWERDEKSRKEKKIVYHLNEHSDGIRYRFVWRKRGAFFKNGEFYSLLMTRHNKRAVSKFIKDGGSFITYD